MNDILLATLILFSGFVPVSIALYYSKRLLQTANNMYESGIAEREATVKEMKEWLLGEKFTTHIQRSIKGAYGREVRKVKEGIQEQALIQGLPPPAKKAISKGISGFLEDYGMSKKTVKGVEAGIMALFNRKSKDQIAQQDNMIRSMMGPVDQNILGGNYPPEMP